MKNEKVVVLACGRGSCCPELVFHDDGSVTVRDLDDGRNDQVRLSAAQAKMMKAQLNERLP